MRRRFKRACRAASTRALAFSEDARRNTASIPPARLSRGCKSLMLLMRLPRRIGLNLAGGLALRASGPPRAAACTSVGIVRSKRPRRAAGRRPQSMGSGAPQKLARGRDLAYGEAPWAIPGDSVSLPDRRCDARSAVPVLASCSHHHVWLVKLRTGHPVAHGVPRTTLVDMGWIAIRAAVRGFVSRERSGARLAIPPHLHCSKTKDTPDSREAQVIRPGVRLRRACARVSSM